MLKLQLQGMPASSWIPNAVVLFATWEAWTGKQAELFGGQFELFCIPSIHHHDSRDPLCLSLSLSVSLCLSAHSLSPDAMTWWASAGSCGPFDLLNNLPGIWYYDVTMEAVKNSPYEYSRIRLLSLASPCVNFIPGMFQARAQFTCHE